MGVVTTSDKTNGRNSGERSSKLPWIRNTRLRSKYVLSFAIIAYANRPIPTGKSKSSDPSDVKRAQGLLNRPHLLTKTPSRELRPKQNYSIGPQKNPFILCLASTHPDLHYKSPLSYNLLGFKRIFFSVDILSNNSCTTLILVFLRMWDVTEHVTFRSRENDIC